MSGFVSTRAFEPEPRTLADVFAEAAACAIRKRMRGKYSQTADQLTNGPEESRRRISESFDFKPNADRYALNNKTGQYLLDLPPQP